jgi:hypothetical protein
MSYVTRLPTSGTNGKDGCVVELFHQRIALGSSRLCRSFKHLACEIRKLRLGISDHAAILGVAAEIGFRGA